MKTRAGFYVAALLSLAVAAANAPVFGSSIEPAVFQVGAAVRDITPNPTVAPPDGRVNLGGSGLGQANRRGGDGKSTGVEMPISVRAMVVSNNDGETLAFAINETQGSFAKYQQCDDCGLDDMRKEISAQTGLPTSHIVLGSDHSHRGPDTTFVWGGVPTEYLQYIHTRP